MDLYDVATRGQLRRVILTDVNDQGAQQYASLSGVYGEQMAEVTRLQHFGFNAVPPKGSEGLLLALGGRSDKAFVLGLEHPQYRPKAKNPGESYVYDAYGNIISVVQQNIRIVHSADVQIVVGSMVVRVRSNRIDLGALNAPNEVMTTAGASSKVFAVI